MAAPVPQSFNAAHYLLHRHLAEGSGERIAIREPAGEVSYARLSAQVANAAAALRQLGLRPDERVLIVSSDGTPMVATILAAFHAGLVAVPVSTMVSAEDLGKLIRDCGARLVMCSAEFTQTLNTALTGTDAAASGGVEFILHVGDPGALAQDGRTLVEWGSFLAAGAAAATTDPGLTALAPTSEDTWALWLYTSGTTGLPKAAMHRHANIRHVCATYGAQVLDLEPDDSCLSVAKLFFAYGIGNSLFFPFSVAATAVLEPRRPTPEVIAERLRRDRPTYFFAVPTFFAALLASDLPAETFESVKWAVSAGEPLPAPLQRRFTDRFGVEVLDGIGSTEALHIFLSNHKGDICPGSTGTAVPGYDVEVRDEAGRALGPGEPGALYVRGESIALGYWRRTEATRQVFEGTWLSTGDTYVRDEQGYFHCLGRNSDMLKAGGIWVSPAEVESRLLEHDGVREAAVVGLPDADGLDKPVAVVVADQFEPEELIEWCRDGLAHFKAPRQVLFVDELPKTATGKLQRFKVRDLLATDYAALHAANRRSAQEASQS